jgi:hypothetical protein
MMHCRPVPQVFADPQQLPYLEPEQVWPTAAPHLPAEEVGSTVEVVEVLVEVLLVLVVEVVLVLMVLVVLVTVEVIVLMTVEVTPPVRDQHVLEVGEGIRVRRRAEGCYLCLMQKTSRRNYSRRKSHS